MYSYFGGTTLDSTSQLGVIPILIGPLQVLMAILPAILLSVLNSLRKMLRPSSLKIFAKVLWRNKIAVVLAVAAVAGLFYLGAYVHDLLKPAGSVDTGKSEWAMFRGGAARTGSIPGDTSPDPTSEKNVWTFKKRATFYSSPTVLSNMIFATSVEGVGPINAGYGNIYCIDPVTGKELRDISTPEGMRATFCSPSVSGDYMVCGEGLHEVNDARVFCLNLNSNKVLWSIKTHSHAESSAALLDGCAYIGGGKDGFYGLKLDTPDGKDPIMWHLSGLEKEPAKKFHCDSSPVAVNGRVYFSSAMTWNGIVCVDAKTGKEIWHREAPFPVWGIPSIVSNRMFIGMGNGNFIETAEQVRTKVLKRMEKEEGASKEELEKAGKQLAPGGELWCVDTETGETVWSYKTAQCVLGAVAVAASDGKLYFGDRGGTVTRLGMDGKSALKRELHEPLIASPALGKNNVYFVTDKGRLVCLDKDTLEPVWKMQIDQEGCVSSPAIANGHIYVGTKNNGLICVGEPSTSKKIELWAGAFGGPGKSGWTDRSPVPPSGKFGWRYPDDADAAPDTPAVPAQLSAPPAYYDGSLLVAMQSPRTGIARLELLENKTQPWKEVWFLPTTNAVASAPAAVADRIFFVDGKQGDKGRKLHAVDFKTGKEIEATDVSADASGELVLTATNSLLVYDGDNRLSIYDPGNTVTTIFTPVRTCEVKSPVGVPCVAGDMILAVQGEPSSVVSICRFSGQKLAEWPLAAAPRTGPIVFETKFAVGTEKGVQVMSTADGAILWSTNSAAASDRLICDQSRLAWVDAAGVVRVTDWNGNELAKVEGGQPGLSPMLCDESLVYLGKDFVGTIGVQNAETKKIAGSLSWLGAPQTGAIVVKSQIFYGTKGKGLICIKAK